MLHNDLSCGLLKWRMPQLVILWIDQMTKSSSKLFSFYKYQFRITSIPQLRDQIRNDLYKLYDSFVKSKYLHCSKLIYCLKMLLLVHQSFQSYFALDFKMHFLLKALCAVNIFNLPRDIFFFNIGKFTLIQIISREYLEEATFCPRGHP